MNGCSNPVLAQLIYRFVTNNTLMTWQPYQLSTVMFDQLYEGLVAIPDQFSGETLHLNTFH
jgi:hypothetical protein